MHAEVLNQNNKQGKYALIMTIGKLEPYRNFDEMDTEENVETFIHVVS
jgi:hypothetical protein